MQFSLSEANMKLQLDKSSGYVGEDWSIDRLVNWKLFLSAHLFFHCKGLAAGKGRDLGAQTPGIADWF